MYPYQLRRFYIKYHNYYHLISPNHHDENSERNTKRKTKTASINYRKSKLINKNIRNGEEKPKIDDKLNNISFFPNTNNIT